jgi:hypothetical protein
MNCKELQRFISPSNNCRSTPVQYDGLFAPFRRVFLFYLSGHKKMETGGFLLPSPATLLLHQGTLLPLSVTGSIARRASAFPCVENSRV